MLTWEECTDRAAAQSRAWTCRQLVRKRRRSPPKSLARSPQKVRGPPRGQRSSRRGRQCSSRKEPSSVRLDADRGGAI